MRNKYLEIIIVGLGAIIFGLIFFAPQMAGRQSLTFPNQKPEALATKAFFADWRSGAATALVYDVNAKGGPYAKNIDQPVPLASIAKIMTALVAKEALPTATLISIGKEAIHEEGDTGLILNERWRLRDLIDFTLVTSS